MTEASSVRMEDDDTRTTTLTPVDHGDTGSEKMDNIEQTTQLYSQIYRLLVTSDDGTQHTIDVLKPDFDNAKLRNIILMLLLANNVKLNPTTAFTLQSDNSFALQQQLRENNGGRALPDEQNLSFEEQMGSKGVPFVNWLSDLKIQPNNLTFIFGRETKAFEKIVQIAQTHGLELPEDVDKQETFRQFEISFGTNNGMRQCQDIINLNPSFIPDKDNNSYSAFILQVMLPIIQQLAFTGIQKTNPELITKIISGNYNNIIQQRIAQILNDALQHQQPLPLLDLNNLLDENIAKVYNIAKLFIDSERHPLTDEQKATIVEIARTNKNPEVLKAIMEQECFTSDFDIMIAIAKNKNAELHIIYNCGKNIGRIIDTLRSVHAGDLDESLFAAVKNEEINSDIAIICGEALLKNLSDKGNREQNREILLNMTKRCALCSRLWLKYTNQILEITETLVSNEKEDETAATITELINTIAKNYQPIFNNPDAEVFATPGYDYSTDIPINLNKFMEHINTIVKKFEKEENKKNVIEAIFGIIEKSQGDIGLSYISTILEITKSMKNKSEQKDIFLKLHEIVAQRMLTILKEEQQNSHFCIYEMPPADIMQRFGHYERIMEQVLPAMQVLQRARMDEGDTTDQAPQPCKRPGITDQVFEEAQQSCERARMGEGDHDGKGGNTPSLNRDHVSRLQMKGNNPEGNTRQ